MIGEHPSYHQAITGAEAEHRLKQRGGHCYLIRYSKKNRCYVLSVYKEQRSLQPEIEHFEIIVGENGKHSIEGKVEAFDSIESLLEYYEQNRINPSLSSIGREYTYQEAVERAESRWWKRCTIF